MSSKIFQNLTDEIINNFISRFSACKNLFYHPANKNGLLHAGEFGTYREQICMDFLRLFVPQKFEFGTGFLINVEDWNSTQCDIVIYDRLNTPPIESLEKQRFFPMESVAAVGEIKSDLTFSKLKESVVKLAAIKANRAVNNAHPCQQPEKKYDNKNPFDYIVTFIICNKFDFCIKDKNWSDLYSDEIEKKYMHNFILSINDGILINRVKKPDDNGYVMHCYPIFHEKDVKHFFVNANEKNDHIIKACWLTFQALSFCRTFIPDSAQYISDDIYTFTS